jgi:hypothetical protein
MELDIITKQDLEQFRMKMLADIKELIEQRSAASPKPWIKGTDVRKMLGISSGTLQKYRVQGLLKSTKIGGVHFYRYQDVENMFTRSRE